MEYIYIIEGDSKGVLKYKDCMVTYAGRTIEEAEQTLNSPSEFIKNHMNRYENLRIKKMKTKIVDGEIIPIGTPMDV